MIDGPPDSPSRRRRRAGTFDQPVHASPSVYDDIPRSAHEMTPDQRHDGVPPAWWRELARTDLPQGPGPAAVSEMLTTTNHAPMIHVISDSETRVARPHTWLFASVGLVLILAGALMLRGDAAAQLIGVAMVGAVVGVLIRLVRTEGRPGPGGTPPPSPPS